MRILYDTHMHTPLCKHAVGEPEEYAEVARARGLRGVIFTCHNPAPNGWASSVRMDLDQFVIYTKIVERARRAWSGQIDVRLGLESDYAPGMEPWLERLHGMAELHYVLGSVHCQLPEYKELFWTGNAVEYQKKYFENLANAAETKLFDCISHPDLVKNMFPSQWNPERVMEDICASLDRIAKSGVAMELNTSGLNKSVEEMNPGPRILREMHARKIPVVVGSDAHTPVRVAADFEQAFDTLTEIGYREVSYFLDRERREVSIADARASLLTLD